MTQRAILLHGLWMRPLSMALLARRLERAGFRTQVLGYATVRGGPDDARRRLRDALRDGPAHVVAHSLGGLVAVDALRRHPDLPVGRVVCLGSPLCGSAAAGRLTRMPLLSASLGRSRDLLQAGCPPWAGRQPVGMIAGDRALGLGHVLGRLEGASDGTVAVDETRLEGLADHVVVSASHTGLVLAPAAARQVIAFLREGRFER